MKYGKKEINLFLKLVEKENALSNICKRMDLNPYEVLGLANYLKSIGLNIVIKKTYNDIFMVNMGDLEYHEKTIHNFTTDDSNEFKFIVISDTRLGSKSQQLSILNDIYKKGHNMGYNTVFLCGNISAGLYPITDTYADTNFVFDTQSQIAYIVENYPYIYDMKTYFITGKLDEKHQKQNKINIGKRISDLRSDMVYLGENSCNVFIDKVVMQLLNTKLNKTYTVSYRTQQQIDSYRSEDKPDILLYGGILQNEKYRHRSVKALSIPSVCATTKEMNDKRYANTIGAWYVTIKTNEKGYLEDWSTTWSPYYVTSKDEYLKVKPLKIKEEDSKKLVLKNEGGK